MTSTASIGDLVAAELVAEGAAKGYAIDPSTPAAIQEIRQGVAPAAAQPVVGAQRVQPGTRPDLFPTPPVTTPIVDEAATEVDEPVVPLVEFPEIPVELRELLDDDDDDFANVPADTDSTDDEPLVYEDELAKLRRENAKLAKKAAFADDQRQKAQIDKWTKEAEKFFPLSTPSTITADSRRGFLRAAEAQHNAVKNNPVTARYHEQAVAQAKAEAERILAEARAQAEGAWGRPTAGPGLVPVQEAVDQDALAKARRSGNLADVIGHLIGNVPGRR